MVCQLQWSKLHAMCHLCRHEQLLPSPGLDSASHLSPLYSTQLINPSNLHHPCPVVKSHHSAGGAHMVLVFFRVQVMVDQPPSEFQAASDALPKYVPAVATPTPPRHCSGSKSPLHPTAELSLWCWQPRYSAGLGHGVMGLDRSFCSGLGMCQGSHWKPSSHWSCLQSALSVLPQEQDSTHMLLTSKAQPSDSPPVSPSQPA